MKKLKVTFIILFFIILMLPVATFNWEENVVSEIDNRVLANNPFGKNSGLEEGADLTQAIETYAEDRIGFRNGMIRIYTKLNDGLFHEMVHPSYTYGKDDYIFMKSDGNLEFWDFHIVFADMVSDIQEYCEARGVPFVFVFEPSKSTVLQKELADGTNYDNSWVDLFFQELDDRGVNYIDNTALLEEKTKEGEMVFNKQYDAGHWNDLGAFYGVNHILEALKKECPAIHVNTLDEFEISEWTATTLPVSETPIYDIVPKFTSKAVLDDWTGLYDAEVKRDEQNCYFAYVVNEERKAEGSPKTLVFQGSYMNGTGHKFLENSLGEYIAVHDYVNITNFDYYYNIFKPECVVFEVGEYTLVQDYFPYADMESFHLNPVLDTLSDRIQIKDRLDSEMYVIENGTVLSTFTIKNLPANIRWAYLFLNGEIFDMKREGMTADYSVTVEKDKMDTEHMTVVAVSDTEMVYFEKQGVGNEE